MYRQIVTHFWICLLDWYCWKCVNSLSYNTLSALKTRYHQAEKFSANIILLWKATRFTRLYILLQKRECIIMTFLLLVCVWNNPHCRIQIINYSGSVYSRLSKCKHHQNGWKRILMNYFILRDEYVLRFQNCHITAVGQSIAVTTEVLCSCSCFLHSTTFLSKIAKLILQRDDCIANHC